MKKFSLIMGTYNPKQEWLVRAIQSANGLFDEMIIVDDGSTNDVNVHVIESEKLDDCPLKIIKHETNKGFAEAKNTAIKNATGDIICILDDDDYFDRDGVTELKKFVEENDSDVWHFILREFNEGSGLFLENTTPDGLPWNNTIAGVSWFKKSMWEDIGGYSHCVAEDWEFWLRAFLHKKKFTYCPIIAYNMNRRHDSTSMSWTGDKFEANRREVRKYNNLE